MYQENLLFLNMMIDFGVALVMGGLCVFSCCSRCRKNTGGRLFLLMSISVLVYALCNGAQLLVTLSKIDPTNTAVLTLYFVAETAALIFSFQWLLYVDFMIYGSRDQLFRRYAKFAIPLLVQFALDFLWLLALLTGGTGSAASEVLNRIWLYYSMVLLLFYFGASVLVAFHYDRKVRKLHFFHPLLMLVPLGVYALIELFLPMKLYSLAYASAVLIMWITLLRRWRFDDEESGFYNARYLDEILLMKGRELRDYQAAMQLLVKQSFAELAEILKGLLPREVEVLRLNENSALLLLESEKEAVLDRFEKSFQQQCSEYDRRNPQSPMALEVRRLCREETEDIHEFIRRAKEFAGKTAQ